jgi:hypothetical protein
VGTRIRRQGCTVPPRTSGQRASLTESDCLGVAAAPGYGKSWSTFARQKFTRSGFDECSNHLEEGLILACEGLRALIVATRTDVCRGSADESSDSFSGEPAALDPDPAGLEFVWSTFKPGTEFSVIAVAPARDTLSRHQMDCRSGVKKESRLGEIIPPHQLGRMPGGRIGRAERIRVGKNSMAAWRAPIPQGAMRRICRTLSS